MNRQQRVKRREQRWPGLKNSPWLFWGLAIASGLNSVWLLATGYWDQAVGAIMLGGLFAFQPALLRRSYRNGWLDGRLAMLLSIGEASQRGLTPTQWAQAEAERDGVHIKFVEEL